jgi:hypothetical protein
MPVHISDSSSDFDELLLEKVPNPLNEIIERNNAVMAGRYEI